MRKISIVFASAALLASLPASAEQSRALKFDQSNSAKSLRVKEPKSDNSCAAYGAGFVKIAGTNTCMKVGGAISVGVGGSITGR